MSAFCLYAFYTLQTAQSLGNQSLVSKYQRVRQAQFGAADKCQITGSSPKYASTTKTYILSVKKGNNLKQNTLTQKSEQAHISALS